MEAAFPAPGLTVWQPRSYHYGVEVYLLADFALRGGFSDRVVEFGGGSGVISLLMAQQGAAVTLVEREAAWLALARQSAEASGMLADTETPGRVTLVEGDVRSWEGTADLVISNPPWFPADQPRSPDPLRAAARSMLAGTVEDFAVAALRAAPRFCLVTRPERAMELEKRGWAGGGCRRRARVGSRLTLLELGREPTQTEEEPLDIDAAYARWGMPGRLR